MTYCISAHCCQIPEEHWKVHPRNTFATMVWCPLRKNEEAKLISENYEIDMTGSIKDKVVKLNPTRYGLKL